MLRCVIAIAALWTALTPALKPALAQDQVRIGLGFGFAFLPLYICEDLKLIEKQARAAHLDVQAKFRRFADSGELHAALAGGEIDIGPFGTAPLLMGSLQGKKAGGQILAVSGMTSLPLLLLSNQPDEHSIADLKPSDRIAMPTLTSPQMYLLEMQSEKTFGKFDRLRNQVVMLSHPQAIAALAENTGQATAYFSSPPYAHIALRAPNVHVLLRSSDVIDGKSSFLILGAERSYVGAQPQVAEIIAKAIDEAARLIREDPKRAAQLYLTHEPSAAINGATMEAIVREVKDEFGSPIYGVQATADFMVRLGELKTPLGSWKEIAAPALLNSPST
ncbi:MAG TPA: ABC transporter substrate-binding protein [Xanthobacteraceae bacterium]|nr:ABC transporter substrate-binding protein [Xanthobacteraceae bacterium]